MGDESFSVVVSHDAWGDISEIAEYWQARGEAWRGEKYFRDLVHAARIELTDPVRARRGRRAKGSFAPEVCEILAFGVYRIIYEIDEAAARVDILRFRQAHRDTPPLE